MSIIREIVIRFRAILPAGFALLSSIVLTTPGASAEDRASQLGLKVPDGFEVVEYADSSLANDIFSMTIDARGRLVVSGPGYIRILVDENGDGRADRAIDFPHAPRDGAQGLLWESDCLYFTGAGGLWRYRTTANGVPDRPSELIRAMRTGDEHHAHGIRRGPDGWLYVVCGNSTRIDRSYAQLATSPVKEPVAGCILRFTPDLSASEIVADGFRNPYRMDFNADGELFTFESDNERCVSLPWYEPTRFYHVIHGRHYGWEAPQRADTWRLPPYFCDVATPLAYLGRGSPTGVVCYRHHQFPEKYRGGMFLLDWTFGRIYFVKLQRGGASYGAHVELFAEATGDNGFAPTDAVVHPATGDLYVSIGGRGTRGAVYRIRYRAGNTKHERREPATARSRLGLAGKGQLGPLQAPEWLPGMDRALLESAASQDSLGRLRALGSLRRFFTHFETEKLVAAVRQNAGHPDRDVRCATAELIASLPETVKEAMGNRRMTPREETTYCQGIYRSMPRAVLQRLAALLSSSGIDPDVRLASIRLVQLALGDLMDPHLKGTVWEGYSARLGHIDRKMLGSWLPSIRLAVSSGIPDIDREAARTLAMVEDDLREALARVADHLAPNSDPVDDIHYLVVLGRLRGPREKALTKRIADSLLNLDTKLTRERRNRDRNWPLRIAELLAGLAARDPNLNEMILGSPEFGRPDHVLFTRCPGFDRPGAAEIFVARAARDKEFAWNPGLVELISCLPDERCFPVLRAIWDRGGMEQAILPVLARNPQCMDRDKFLDGLNSPQLFTVIRCLEALEKLPDSREPGELLALVRCLVRLPSDRAFDSLRTPLVRRLEHMTGHHVPNTNKTAWADWLRSTHPELARRLEEGDPAEVARWRKRLATLDWSQGSAERGRRVFERAACASCHSGGHALGPDLHGVTGRFSRDDLFTAILQPSKDIAPRYRAIVVALADGKIYQGLPVYEAVDSLLLQTGPITTVRLDVEQIVSRRVSPVSLMPSGLLDKLGDGDIADLYAYLRTMGER